MDHSPLLDCMRVVFCDLCSSRHKYVEKPEHCPRPRVLGNALRLLAPIMQILRATVSALRNGLSCGR